MSVDDAGEDAGSGNSSVSPGRNDDDDDAGADADAESDAARLLRSVTSISPSVLFDLLRVLDKVFHEEVPKRFASEVFRVLSDMANARGPSAFFDMGDGGIRVLGPIQKWSPNSFTFACWVYPMLATNSALFCVSGAYGSFVSISVDTQGVLLLSSSTSFSSPILRAWSPQGTLPANAWQFVAVRVTRGRSGPLLSKKPQLEVAVNQQFIEMQVGRPTFDIPKFTSAVDCSIGYLAEAVAPRLPDVAPFSGYYGLVFALNDRITSISTLDTFFQSGMESKMPVLSDATNGNIFTKLSSSISGKSSENILGCFTFAFHPLATNDNICTDISPADSETGSLFGELYRNAVATIKWKYCDVILHHIELFVPLFAHINSFNASVFDVHTAILLIWNLAFKDPYSVVRFTGDRLWPALGHLLLDVDPRHITTSCVEAYQHMLLQLWDCTRDGIKGFLGALCVHILRMDWWARPGVDPAVTLQMAELCRTILLGHRHNSVPAVSPWVVLERTRFHLSGTDETTMLARHLLMTALVDICDGRHEEVIMHLNCSAERLHCAQLLELLAELVTASTDKALCGRVLDAVIATVGRFSESSEILIAAIHCVNVVWEVFPTDLPGDCLIVVVVPLVCDILKKCASPLSDNVLYRSLLEVFFKNSPPGSLGVDNVIGWMFTSTAVDGHFILPELSVAVRGRTLANLNVLFSVIEKFPDVTVPLNHLAIALESQSHNVDILLAIKPPDSWLGPLFSLVSWECQLDHFLSAGANRHVFRIITIALVHSVMHCADGVVIIRNTLASLRMSCQSAASSFRSLERILFHELMNGLYDSCPLLVGVSPSESLSANICALGDLLEAETWCSPVPLFGHPGTARQRRLSATSIDSFSEASLTPDTAAHQAENWIICSDDANDDHFNVSASANDQTQNIANIIADMPHVSKLIAVVLRLRLPLYFAVPNHPYNLLRVLLHYLSEAIASSVSAHSERELQEWLAMVRDLVDLAATNPCFLAGTNCAVVLFLQRMCSIQISALQDVTQDATVTSLCMLINSAMAYTVRRFSPFIAIQTRHYDDPTITNFLLCQLKHCRFGELQTAYVYPTAQSAPCLAFPHSSETGPAFCIPIDIAEETHTFLVHSHTLELLAVEGPPAGLSVGTSVHQALFVALNEMVHYEQTTRLASFAETCRLRSRLEATVKSTKSVLAELAVQRSERVSNANASGLTQMRSHCDADGRRQQIWSLNEKTNQAICRVAVDRLIKAAGHIGVIRPTVPQLFWGVASASSSCCRPVLEPFVNGSLHEESSHSFLIEQYNSSNGNSKGIDVTPGENIPHRGIAIGSSPSNDIDWDLCDVNDDGDFADDVVAQLSPRRMMLALECHLITPVLNVQGTLRLDASTMTFEHILLDGTIPDDVKKSSACTTLDTERQYAKRPRRWNLDQLRSVQRRRYQLQHSALEFFFDCGETVFVDLGSAHDQRRVIQEIALLKPANLDPAYAGTPRSILRKTGLTRRWQRREISNFEYLCRLNIISGRTLQDLNQYPIFPWVLSDYSSPSISLDDPSVFRDLSFPIGAQSDGQRKSLRERYDHFVGSSTPQFHFGSHYSNAAIVLFFLLRLEPFASLHIELQDGRFDFPDRLFSSIEQTFNVCTTSRASVKELTPEFFYLPEAFVNINKFDLGVRQNGIVVDDAVLPPWAKGDANLFIRIQREALESEYVSANLPHWIDMIWGYKQRGDAAKDAFNVFFHLSYEGAVDLDSVLDPVQRAAMRSQIGQWGQIPTQMFNKPHVHREPLIVSPHGVKPPKASPSKIFRIEGFDDASVSASSLFVVGEGRSVVVVASDHTTHQLVLTCKDQVSLHPLAVTSASTDLGGSPTHPNSPTMPNAVAWSASGRYVITGNHWDGSVRFYRFGSLSSQAGGSNPFLKLAAYSLLQCLRTHEGRVVSVSLSPCQRLLACGSSDCTVSLWKVSLDDGFSRVPHIEERPSSILVGHDSSVVCVAINSDMDACVSCSSMQGCLLHRVSTGALIKRIILPENAIPKSVFISALAYIVVSCDCTRDCSKSYLSVFNMNGRRLSTRQCCRVDIHSEVICNINHKGDLLVRVCDSEVDVLSLPDLECLQSCVSPTGALRCTAFSGDDQLILTGSLDGRIALFTV